MQCHEKQGTGRYLLAKVTEVESLNNELTRQSIGEGSNTRITGCRIVDNVENLLKVFVEEKMGYSRFHSRRKGVKLKGYVSDGKLFTITGAEGREQIGGDSRRHVAETLSLRVVLDRVISCVLFVVAVAIDHAKIDISPYEHCYLATTILLFFLFFLTDI